jgi:hypothetical protein
MRLIITCVSAYIALLIYGFTAMAQDDEPLSLPVSQWSVNKVFKDNGFPTRECVMTTSFDNGMEIAFKGKGERLSALRIKDVSGSVSSKVSGFVGLGLGKNSYGLQSRSMAGQVDSSLLTVAHVADKIVSENMFRLKIGGENYYFSGVGFEQAHDELLTCLGRKNLKTLKVVSDDIIRLPRTPKANLDMPAEPVDVVVAEPVDVMKVDEPVVKQIQSNEKEDDGIIANHGPESLLTPEISGKSDGDKPLAEWVASKGQKVSMVLGEWGAKEGVNVAVQLDNNPVILEDFAFDGSFSDAVNKLINDNMEWVGTRPTAVLKSGQGVETQLTGYKDDGRVKNVRSGKNTYDDYRWRALEGTNLRKVLQQWAKRENVGFVWQADQTFLIRESVKSTTEFPDAVASLLAQYEDQSIRPIAQLNTDPKTGEVSLIVKVLKSAS